MKSQKNNTRKNPNLYLTLDQIDEANLSPLEDKLEKRRLKNRLAAEKCRNKTLQKIADLEAEVADVLEKEGRLKLENEIQKKEIEDLKLQLASKIAAGENQERSQVASHMVGIGSHMVVQNNNASMVNNNLMNNHFFSNVGGGSSGISSSGTNSHLLSPHLVSPHLASPHLASNLVNPNLANPNLMNPNLMNPNFVNPNLMTTTALGNHSLANRNLVYGNFANTSLAYGNLANGNLVNGNIDTNMQPLGHANLQPLGHINPSIANYQVDLGSNNFPANNDLQSFQNSNTSPDSRYSNASVYSVQNTTKIIEESGNDKVEFIAPAIKKKKLNIDLTDVNNCVDKPESTDLPIPRRSPRLNTSVDISVDTSIGFEYDPPLTRSATRR